MADDLGTANRDALYGYGLVDELIGTGTNEPSPRNTCDNDTRAAGDGTFIIGEKCRFKLQ